MSVGFRILERTSQVSDEYVNLFKEIPVANISDSMSRMAAGGAQIRPINLDFTLAGPAITVKTRPGDNLMVHKALDMAKPGDIIVVDAGGDLTNAIMGELMINYAISKKLGGVVIYGAVRDVTAINKGTFPVFASGVTHRGPYKDGPGEVNVPISIEGMVIEPGDLVVGDADGVLSIPQANVAQIYAAAKKKNDLEIEQMQKYKDGTVDRSWVDATLSKSNCEILA